MNNLSKIKKFIAVFISACLVVFALLIGTVYWQQDKIVQHFIEVANQDFKGRIELENSHISPFVNFPYISVDLEKLKVFEDKDTASHYIVFIEDAYIGFDLNSIIAGNFEIKAIKLNKGDIHLVQDTNGVLNIQKAFEAQKEIEDVSEEFNLNLQKISLIDVDIQKWNEGEKQMLDVFVSDANIRFISQNEHIYLGLEADFLMNLVQDGDTNFIKNKHLRVNTTLDYQTSEQIVNIEPSKIMLEEARFDMSGKIDLDNDLEVDIQIEGNKPDFEMFMAFAPNELIPTLRRYENKGKVYFDSRINGRILNGNNPKIVARFGCEDAFFANSFNKKKIDELQFKGEFSSEENGGLSSMQFSITDFSSRPEAGLFKGKLLVKNFESPEIDMQIESDFDLNFLAEFFEVENLKNLRGKVQLNMNFHDIIDLEHPERSLEKINQAYFSELKIEKLGFESPDFHLPIKQIDLHATMYGSQAKIHHFDALIGDSDLKIKGLVSDLPAILHHTADLVTSKLSISSKKLDLKQLTQKTPNDTNYVNEVIENFSVDFAFTSSAKALTESPNLPIGEFFIDNLYAKFKNYPHTLHDFHADVLIDEKDFRVIDFKGEIDQSDFHFSGKLANYDLWFQENPNGDTKVEFELISKLLKMDNLLSYNGVNYLPEDYHHEEWKHVKIKGHADLHFKDSLYSADIYLDNLNALMKVHPLKLREFSGRFHIEDQHLVVDNFKGKMGNSDFAVNLNYYYGQNQKIKKRDNYFSIRSNQLDFDELTNYSENTEKQTEEVNHDSVFNIYDLPFTDMRFEADIKKLNYHKYLIENFSSQLRTTPKHYIYLDTLYMELADGKIYGSAYFNGENNQKIYASPKLYFKHLDIDKLMIKFDNFGQDELVSDNLHGQLSGLITGKVRMHADMVPMIDDSDIHLEFEVVNGRLDNYGPIHAMSDFFRDKNLNRIAFDTLKNIIDLSGGTLSVPAMTINSTLGFIEVSGKQDKNSNMEYFVRVPFNLVTSAAASKLFGKKKEEIDPEQEDEIIQRDPNKKIPFINIRISGTPDDYKISMSKKKTIL